MSVTLNGLNLVGSFKIHNSFVATLPTNGLISEFLVSNISGTTLVDSVSNYNFTISGGVSIVNDMLFLNGSSNYAYGNIPNIGVSTTFSCVVNVTDFSYGNNPIITQSGDRPGFGTQHVRGLTRIDNVTGPDLQLFTRDVSGTWVGVGITDEEQYNNTTIHLCGTQDSGLIKLYINGAVVETTTISSPNTTYYDVFNIGKYTASAVYGRFYIDKIRIYNRALNTSEVNSLYSIDMTVND